MFDSSGLQIAWDNTSISLYKECPQKYYLSIILGYRKATLSPPLLFGIAYHEARETYDRHISEGKDAALRAALRAAWKHSENLGLDPARTRHTLCRAIVWYSEQYSPDPFELHHFSDGSPGLELSFRFELNRDTPSGEKYIYCGHMDKIVNYNGALYALEYKHTTSTLSESYFLRYIYSSQVFGYVAAGQIVFNTPIYGAIIDSVQIGASFSRYSRRVVHRASEHLEEWLSDLTYWLSRVEDSHARNLWAHNTESCHKFGGCPFLAVCSKAPYARDAVLRTEYVAERWNPLRNRGSE